MNWKKGILNIILLEDQNYNSNIPSTSTAAPKGKELTLIAALVCLPPSPNIFVIKSDAPFKTFGWSIKESVEFTYPVSLIHPLTLSNYHTFFLVALKYLMHIVLLHLDPVLN